MKKDYLTSYAFYWTLELVGTSQRLFWNLFFFVLAGVIGIQAKSYSPAIIMVLGGILPVVLNYCLYRLVGEAIHSPKAESVKVKPSYFKLNLMLVIDGLLLLGFAGLIAGGILTGSIFKIIACSVIPAFQLFSLRGVLVFFLS